MTNIMKAMLYAKEKHKGQKDDCNKDYYESHIEPVYKMVRLLTDDKTTLIASILHDTIEDTDATYEEIKREFGTEVADLVIELTHEGEKDEYGYYFPRLSSQKAILIKLCDRASNISRIESWDDERRKQYLKKTKFWKDGTDRNE